MPATETKPYRLSCLELRGGNDAVSYPAEIAGLAGWVSSRPLSPATHGGDLHYLSLCSRGELARVVLADVAGHGEIVSAVADRLREALRQNVERFDQSILIRELNDAFLQGAEGVQFATAFVLSYQSKLDELRYTNAGHLPPLWYRARERKWALTEWIEDEEEMSDLPLGLISGTPYTQVSTSLEHGDILVLYTDGITECRNPAGVPLGIDGLLELAEGLPLGLPTSIGPTLIRAVDEFRGTAPSIDDETVVVLQRLPNSPGQGE
jgi:sigma-B regulation protein RsbU (phosphoserine phosphatase)